MKIGLALGSGSARGWAHIGIIDVLLENGIVPDIVTGSSIGAVVGACYATGNIHTLEENVLALNKLAWTKFFSPSTSIERWLKRDKLREFLIECGIDPSLDIQNTKTPFGCVACNLETGKEKWFMKGPLLGAVWASMSMPGLLPACRFNHHWYIDGGIINPVPVTTCKAMGADVVIAVNLNADILDRSPIEPAKPQPLVGSFKRATQKILPKKILEKVEAESALADEENVEGPGVVENISRSINIAQDIITRSRLAGDPPDVLLCPKLSKVGIIETYRGLEGIEEGRRCCERSLDAIFEAIRE